jgi:hypothetical protein
MHWHREDQNVEKVIDWNQTLKLRNWERGGSFTKVDSRIQMRSGLQVLIILHNFVQLTDILISEHMEMLRSHKGIMIGSSSSHGCDGNC